VRYPLYAAATSGTISTEYVASTKYQFNPSTGVLSATGFSGSGATLTSIPNSALNNSSVTIGSTSVALGATVTTFAGLTSVTSTTFVGALTGNASSATTATTATNATNIAITDNTSSVSTYYPVISSATTGNVGATTSSTKLSFVPNTGVLSATSFSGAGTGLTGTASSLSIGGNAATATSATTATNIAGGSNLQIPYQTASGTTSFITAPTIASTYLQYNGTGFTWAASAGVGTVTSVGQSFTGGLISVSGSPITTAGTLALTVAGTSGGIVYFSSASTWASSGALTQYGVVYGGGAGASPVATAAGTTGQVLIATTSAAPSWGQVSLTAGVTGTLPIANGGTGQTTANTAFNALAPSQTSNSGKYLKTDGTNTSWATISAGKVLQVVTSTNTTQVTITSSTFQTTNHSVSITPLFSTSKIMIFLSATGGNVNSNNIANYTIYRGASNIAPSSSAFALMSTGQSPTMYFPFNITYLDSPATTSSTTYTVYMASQDNTNGVKYNPNPNSITPSSVLTVMEIAA
jgi:hypothetical protein